MLLKGKICAVCFESIQVSRQFYRLTPNYLAHVSGRRLSRAEMTPRTAPRCDVTSGLRAIALRNTSV
jgi:hypothetical protein